MNKPKSYASLRLVEYARRYDGQFNIWRRMKVGGEWELVDVCKTLPLAEKAVAKHQRIGREIRKKMRAKEKV